VDDEGQFDVTRTFMNLKSLADSAGN
jgi:hypothetical protein